jgi:hypothetical protein
MHTWLKLSEMGLVADKGLPVLPPWFMLTWK